MIGVRELKRLSDTEYTRKQLPPIGPGVWGTELSESNSLEEETTELGPGPLRGRC